MGPEALAQVLRPLANFLPADRASSLLSGMAEGDDAAVYRLNDGQCLIFTVDFFTPVVDDPYDFGAIAAANAMSDVYATGGEPILALNLAAFPPDLSPAVMEAIFRGGAEKAYEANCALAGGNRHGSRSSGSPHNTRAICTGASIRLDRSMLAPTRPASACSSPSGNALSTLTSRVGDSMTAFGRSARSCQGSTADDTAADLH